MDNAGYVVAGYVVTVVAVGGYLAGLFARARRARRTVAALTDRPASREPV